jgi:hypothetical protein
MPPKGAAATSSGGRTSQFGKAHQASRSLTATLQEPSPTNADDYEADDELSGVDVVNYAAAPPMRKPLSTDTGGYEADNEEERCRERSDDELQGPSVNTMIGVCPHEAYPGEFARLSAESHGTSSNENIGGESRGKEDRKHSEQNEGTDDAGDAPKHEHNVKKE